VSLSQRTAIFSSAGMIAQSLVYMKIESVTIRSSLTGALDTSR
jgi:hypothetical protein